MPSRKFISVLTVAILIFAIAPTKAEDLCPINADREEGSRIPEQYFSRENAIASAKLILEITENDAPNEWFTFPNASKVIKGYILRKNALESNSKIAMLDFCKFMKEEAWWYD